MRNMTKIFSVGNKVVSAKRQGLLHIEHFCPHCLMKPLKASKSTARFSIRRTFLFQSLAKFAIILTTIHFLSNL